MMLLKQLFHRRPRPYTGPDRRASVREVKRSLDDEQEQQELREWQTSTESRVRRLETAVAVILRRV